jgi:galactokinase
MAIDLRFNALISKREDGRAVIMIKDENIDTLNQVNDGASYEKFEYDLTKKLVYNNSRDYFKSCFNVIKKRGYDISCGFDIKMDSDIPIGKGMCSSSTMIVVLIKAVLEALDADIKDDKSEIAQMGYEAEVAEFNEPGGKMDHMASAYGGVCRFDFSDIRNPVMYKLKDLPAGGFILFDSLQRKDTIRVLATARRPVETAVKLLGSHGIKELSTEDIEKADIADNLKKPALAAKKNYRILKMFLSESEQGAMTPERFGELLYEHHKELRDGLSISTPAIEEILDTAISNGALGGKLNGTGGGGCCYVFAHEKDLKTIKAAVEKRGYPARIIHTDGGSGVDWKGEQ